MSALTRMSRAYGHVTTKSSLPINNGIIKRGLATEEVSVSWSQYRSGEKTFQEWVEGNRQYVAFGFFSFYVSLGLYQLRPGKKKKTTQQDSSSEIENSSKA